MPCLWKGTSWIVVEGVMPLVRLEIGVAHWHMEADPQCLLCHWSGRCIIWASCPMQPVRPSIEFLFISARDCPGRSPWNQRIIQSGIQVDVCACGYLPVCMCVCVSLSDFTTVLGNLARLGLPGVRRPWQDQTPLQTFHHPPPTHPQAFHAGGPVWMKPFGRWCTIGRPLRLQCTIPNMEFFEQYESWWLRNAAKKIQPKLIQQEVSSIWQAFWGFGQRWWHCFCRQIVSFLADLPKYLPTCPDADGGSASRKGT